MTDPAPALLVEALKPCPFCGGRAELKEGIHTQYVMCIACEVMGPNLKDKDELVAAWNRRVALTPSPLAQERGPHQYVQSDEPGVCDKCGRELYNYRHASPSQEGGIAEGEPDELTFDLMGLQSTIKTGDLVNRSKAVEIVGRALVALSRLYAQTNDAELVKKLSQVTSHYAWRWSKETAALCQQAAHRIEVLSSYPTERQRMNGSDEE